MKNIIFYLALSCVTLLVMSCEEEDARGQFPIDGTPPGAVSEVSVQNEKGYSVITYSNPLDEDLLYVEANYINSLGKEAIVRASAYSNTMKLTGFLKSKKVPVSVFAVDKSFNKSKTIQIEVEPLDNPMFDVLASIEYQAIFGGVGLSWINATNQDVVVEFLTVNDNIYTTYESFFSNATNIEVSVRGLEAVEAEFAVVVRDEFGQRTDTLTFSATPLFEELISPENFRELAHNPAFDPLSFNTGFSTLWNDNISHPDSYSIFGGGIGKVYFTMDLGEEIKLSRFKMWSREDFIYTHSMPRHIRLLGTNDQALANDPSDKEGEWEVIGEWYDQKPSGGEESDPETDEDLEHFFAGIDFDVDVEVGSYRYLRFTTLESWGKIDRMWMSELKFWGQKQN